MYCFRARTQCRPCAECASWCLPLSLECPFESRRNAARSTVCLVIIRVSDSHEAIVASPAVSLHICRTLEHCTSGELEVKERKGDCRPRLRNPKSIQLPSIAAKRRKPKSKSWQEQGLASFRQPDDAEGVTSSDRHLSHAKIARAGDAGGRYKGRRVSSLTTGAKSRQPPATQPYKTRDGRLAQHQRDLLAHALTFQARVTRTSPKTLRREQR